MQRLAPALGGTLVITSGVLLGVLLIDDGEKHDGASEEAPQPMGRRSPWRPVSIAPRVGEPGTVFRLSAPTSPPDRATPENYAGAELTGPGGRGCRGKLRAHFGLGFEADDDAMRTGSQVRYLPPQRQDPLTPPRSPSFERRLQGQPWCPGRYRIALFELRFKDARPRRLLATLAFEVRGSPTSEPGSRLRASHGVTHVHIGKNVVGWPYRQLLSRLGAPKTVPQDYRRSRGRRCIYYDQVGDDAEDPDLSIATTTQLCLRRGRVHSVSGSPYIPLRGSWR